MAARAPCNRKGDELMKARVLPDSVSAINVLCDLRQVSFHLVISETVVIDHFHIQWFCIIYATVLVYCD